MMKWALVAALIGAVAVAGAAALESSDSSMVDGITYLYSTNLLKKQSGDVIRALDTSEWDNGLVPKGMHKCARLCKKEGGGGICKAFTFCFYDKQCSLLSRLPDSLAAARPATDPAVVSTYNSKCISGFSQGAASYEQLQQSCKATIHTNTLFSDTNTLFSSTKNASRPLKGAYEAAQQSAMDCCKLCDSMRDSGCTSWSYQPDGWLLDRSRRCTLRTGVNPAVSAATGVTSGVMQQE